MFLYYSLLDISSTFEHSGQVPVVNPKPPALSSEKQLVAAFGKSSPQKFPSPHMLATEVLTNSIELRQHFKKLVLRNLIFAAIHMVFYVNPRTSTIYKGITGSNYTTPVPVIC